MHDGEGMINKELGLALDAIIKDAKKRRHEYLTAEHILFALIHDELGIDIITGCGGDVGGGVRRAGAGVPS